MADTSNSVLFDAPGPKGRRTIRIVNWIAGILFAVVLVLILMRLHNPPDGENQLSWELWKPAIEREAWTDFYLPGLWMTIKATVVAVVGAVVFGLVFGSVFGFEHVLDPLYHALFGLEEKPIEVMNPSMTVNIILGAVLIGLFLIMVAMVLNIVSSLRRRDYESGLFGPNGIAGLVFYASLVAGLGGQFIGLHLISVPYVLALIVLPLLLIFLREPLGRLAAGDPDWKPEKWGEFILQNFFELFEIMLSYLSNTMSFLRVGAFVLVHAGMMMAVFAIAELFGPLGFTIAVIIGNALVMGMEALLVSIQVMRLEFYEMFSRYYVGDGRAFQPLSVSADK